MVEVYNMSGMLINIYLMLQNISGNIFPPISSFVFSCFPKICSQTKMLFLHSFLGHKRRWWFSYRKKSLATLSRTQGVKKSHRELQTAASPCETQFPCLKPNKPAIQHRTDQQMKTDLVQYLAKRLETTNDCRCVRAKKNIMERH